MNHFLLAQDSPQVPWNVTSNWMWGLIGFLGIIFLVLGVINQARKLFARRPPVDDELTSLRNEIAAARAKADNGRKGLYQSMEGLRAETDAKIFALKDGFHTKLEEFASEIRADGARRLESLNDQFRDIASTLGRLDERTKHLK